MKSSIIKLSVVIFLLGICVNTFAQHSNEIFVSVENPPTFPGGEEELVKFLSQNVKYPSISEKNNVQGTVYVRFVVEVDGSLSNINILRGLDEHIDAEVFRVISTMPKWKPGTQAGKPVRVYMHIPVKFIK